MLAMYLYFKSSVVRGGSMFSFPPSTPEPETSPRDGVAKGVAKGVTKEQPRSVGSVATQPQMA